MKIKAIIFDVDGLMADTEFYHCESVKKLMSSYGVKLSRAYLVKTVGVSSKNNFIKIKKDFGVTESLKKLLAAREKLYLKIIKASDIKVFPGLKDIFEYAKKKGIKIAVGSSSIKAQIDVVVPLLMKSAGVRISYRKYFNAVVTGSDVKNTKPAPDIYKLVSKKLGVEPENCLVLEDSVSGVKAAKAAKMFCIAVKSEYTKNKDLVRADVIVNNLEKALKKIIKIGEK
ncbi:MAG: hypothetical protein A2452_05080 [Candidatus Firestonebacteria bacterium RIFOXYC2_FULL_39_67]|nr:MAG: hypothetical protein A2536_04885 [Candidatus Firestonebacteria bacterium RIFOXYD2_FULL_39_29]OGF57260.1 MAG: hypothetical protein A2452_05080 [Candidatus Firestonebacteria bacterium RIFOXYC2_FULL_39_67]